MVGVDSNMCCGTHVSNLSHLQVVKLLHTESKQGLTLLYFVGGNRVCNLLLSNSLFPSEPGDCRQTFHFTISCICLLVLSSGPEDHLAAVKKLVCVSACVCVCMCMYVCWCQCPLWVLCPGV